MQGHTLYLLTYCVRRNMSRLEYARAARVLDKNVWIWSNFEGVHGIACCTGSVELRVFFIIGKDVIFP